MLAIGLIPENELSRMAGIDIHPVTGGPVVNDLLQTSNPAVFAAGNVVIVYDLVDNVSDEGLIAGANAARFAQGKISTSARIPVNGGENVRLYFIRLRVHAECLRLRITGRNCTRRD